MRHLLNRLKQDRGQRGFTLVELLVVIGIVVVLFSVVLVAVDPAKRLKQARDSVRQQDVRNILEAVQEFIVDNDGDFPSVIDDTDASFQAIGTGGGCSTTCTAETTVSSCVDLSSDLVPTYLAELPIDPATGTEENTDYAINKTDDGNIVVIACDPELEDEIQLQR